MAKVAIITQSVSDKVAHLVAATDPDYLKNARVLAKAVGMDAKFNKWLSSDASKLGIKLFDDAEYREKVLDSITEVTSVEEKQAIVIAMFNANVQDIIKAKDAEVTKNLILTDAQKEAHALQLAKFAKTVERTAKAAIISMGLAFGVIEFEEANAPAPVAQA